MVYIYISGTPIFDNDCHFEMFSKHFFLFEPCLKDYLKRLLIAMQPLSLENYDDAQIKTKDTSNVLF